MDESIDIEVLTDREDKEIHAIEIARFMAAKSKNWREYLSSLGRTLADHLM